MFRYLLLVVALFFTNSIFAQALTQKFANIAYVYPAGAKAGEQTKILIGGDGFSDVEKIYVSGENIDAEIADVYIPAERNLGNRLRQALQKKVLEERERMGYANEDDSKDSVLLSGKALVSAAQEIGLQDELNEITMANNSYRIREASTDALAETIEVILDIDEDAKLGKRYIYVQTPNGLSNPMPIYIDDVDEYTQESLRERALEMLAELEKGNVAKNGMWNLVVQPMNLDPKRIVYPKSPKVVEVDLPAIVNGQLNLTQVDRCSFRAKKSDKVVIEVKARSLIAYLADAVPGWFQAAVSITNSDGKQIAYTDDFYHLPDPLLAVDIPEDGVYFVEIKDAIYRGREDFIYRMLIAKVPFVSGIYPLGVEASMESELKLNGWNLKNDVLKVKLDEVGIKQIDLREKGIYHKDILLNVSDLKRINETEPNNFFRQANELEKGMSVDAKIANKADIDFYKIDLKAQEEVIISTQARKYNSPIDTFLKVYNAEGNIVASNDDHEDISDGMTTHHSDSYIEFKASEAATYYISVEDTQQKSGDEYVYSLTVQEKSVYFEIRIAPAVLNVREGTTQVFKIYAIRRHGLKYDIDLEVEGLPEGMELSGMRINADSDCVSVSLSVAKDKDDEVRVYPVKIYGKVEYGGKTYRKEGLASKDMLQAFYIQHLVPSGELMFVKYKAKVPAWLKKLDLNFPVDKNLKLCKGQEARLNLGVPFGLANAFAYEIVEGFEGLNIKEVENEKGKGVLVFSVDDDVELKKRGNLIIEIYTKKNANNKKWFKKVKLNTLKAIEYELN